MTEDYKRLYEDALDTIERMKIAYDIIKSVADSDWGAYQRMLGIYNDMDEKMEKLRKENYALKVENRELKIELNHAKLNYFKEV